MVVYAACWFHLLSIAYNALLDASCCKGIKQEEQQEKTAAKACAITLVKLAKNKLQQPISFFTLNPRILHYITNKLHMA